MSVTIEQHIKDIRKLRNNLPVWALNKAEAIATQDVIVNIQERVQDKGIDEVGNPFSPYSKSYKKKRKKRGFQTGHKDFTFTTEMWNQFGVVSKKRTSKEINIKLGGKNRDSQIKINVNSKQEEISIIGISKSEENQFIKTFEEEFFKLISATL